MESRREFQAIEVRVGAIGSALEGKLPKARSHKQLHVILRFLTYGTVIRRRTGKHIDTTCGLVGAATHTSECEEASRAIICN